MATPIEMRNEKLANKVIQALESRYFEASWAATKQDALQKALSYLDKEMVISYGGSATTAEIGLLPYLRDNGYNLLDRDAVRDPAEKAAIMRRALTCDTFLMSANAISEDGQMVNVDGNANRVAALCFGPKQVIVIAGMNKVVRSVEDALIRARTIAAPINAGRLGLKTPCNETGVCADCKSPDCICAEIVTTRLCKPAKRIKVILVGEPVGF